MRHARAVALAVTVAGTAGVGACARQGAPPGGPEDLRPPVVADVSPEPFTMVEAGAGRMRVRFSERISERPETGTLDDVVTVSPRTGEVRVSHSRDGLDIELIGGFKANTVYRVTVDPVIRDMFGNPMVVPFEWVFSTGPEFEENAIAGIAFDRVSGEGVGAATVAARRIGADGRPDSVPQVASIDEDGLFAFRWLPAGDYRVEAFVDRDRDGEWQATEAGGFRMVTLAPGEGATADTTSALIRVVTPDTTGARIAAAQFQDSTGVMVRFDDWLDPEVPLETVSIRLAVDQALVDSLLAEEPDPALAEAVARARARMPGFRRIYREPEWQARQDSLRSARAAASDEAAVGDSVAVSADTTGVVADPPVGDPPVEARPAEARPAPTDPAGGAAGEDEEEPELLPDGTPFPIQQLYLLFSGPIPAEVPLRLEITGVWNVSGIAASPSVALRRTPPPPDTVSADSAAVGDSIGGPPGGAAGAADTGGVAADTGGGGGVFRPTRSRPLRDPAERRR